MKLILLASNPKLYSNQRLIGVANSLGYDVSFVNIADCYFKVSTNDCSIFYEGVKINNVDAVIPRIKPALTHYATSLLRQFELANIYCLNNSLAINTSRDKLHTLQILAKHNFPIPTTSFANSACYTNDLINIVNQSPLVIKLLQGTKGVGVMLAETNKTAESIINSFRSLRADILVQQYIKEANGEDFRCFVVGNKVVATMQRIAQYGDFRANIHLGAIGKAVKISDDEEQMAVQASKIIGLDIAGVDMVRSSEGLKILEINSSPGLEGIEKATKIDIAKEIMLYLSNQIKYGK